MRYTTLESLNVLKGKEIVEKIYAKMVDENVLEDIVTLKKLPRKIKINYIAILKAIIKVAEDEKIAINAFEKLIADKKTTKDDITVAATYLYKNPFISKEALNDYRYYLTDEIISYLDHSDPRLKDIYILDNNLLDYIIDNNLEKSEILLNPCLNEKRKIELIEKHINEKEWLEIALERDEEIERFGSYKICDLFDIPEALIEKILDKADSITDVYLYIAMRKISLKILKRIVTKNKKYAFINISLVKRDDEVANYVLENIDYKEYMNLFLNAIRFDYEYFKKFDFVAFFESLRGDWHKNMFINNLHPKNADEKLINYAKERVDIKINSFDDYNNRILFGKLLARILPNDELKNLLIQNSRFTEIVKEILLRKDFIIDDEVMKHILPVEYYGESFIDKIYCNTKDGDFKVTYFKDEVLKALVIAVNEERVTIQAVEYFKKLVLNTDKIGIEDNFYLPILKHYSHIKEEYQKIDRIKGDKSNEEKYLLTYHWMKNNTKLPAETIQYFLLADGFFGKSEYATHTIYDKENLLLEQLNCPKDIIRKKINNNDIDSILTFRKEPLLEECIIKLIEIVSKKNELQRLYSKIFKYKYPKEIYKYLMIFTKSFKCKLVAAKYFKF